MSMRLIMKSTVLAIAVSLLFSGSANARNLSDSHTYDISMAVSGPAQCFDILKQFADENSYYDWDINRSNKEIVHTEDLGYDRRKDASNIRMRCEGGGKLYISVRVPKEEYARYQHDAGEDIRDNYHDFMKLAESSKVDMCVIQGNRGPCKVEAFEGAETTTDTNGYTCNKFTGAKYIGTCSNGFLNNVAVIYRRTEDSHTPHIIIAAFEAGRVVEPFAFHYMMGKGSWSGYAKKGSSHSCTVFGPPGQASDISSTDKGCMELRKMFGSDVLSLKYNHKLKRKKVDIQKLQDHYRGYLQ